MTYKGKYRVKYPKKYKGDPTNVIYRSYWERQTFKWCEENSNVVWWNSESVVVPYRCATDNRFHRYFLDLQIHFSSGETVCVEIKPKAQTQKPRATKGKAKKRLTEETLTYAKNVSKWEAAEAYCRKKGWKFQIWNEETLKALGIKLMMTRDK
jgi:hypothetical protein